MSVTPRSASRRQTPGALRVPRGAGANPPKNPQKGPPGKKLKFFFAPKEKAPRGAPFPGESKKEKNGIRPRWKCLKTTRRRADRTADSGQ